MKNILWIVIKLWFNIYTSEFFQNEILLASLESKSFNKVQMREIWRHATFTKRQLEKKHTRLPKCSQRNGSVRRQNNNRFKASCKNQPEVERSEEKDYLRLLYNCGNGSRRGRPAGKFVCGGKWGLVFLKTNDAGWCIHVNAVLSGSVSILLVSGSFDVGRDLSSLSVFFVWNHCGVNDWNGFLLFSCGCWKATCIISCESGTYTVK